MQSLDELLYEWICRANQRRDDLGLPVGLIEESLALLKRVLGEDYLEQLLVKDSGPVQFLDEEANPLRKWLFSAMVDSHVVQVLELAAYFGTFLDDASLPSKVQKLKNDSFWPVFFELAMAARVKRACRAAQNVILNAEIPGSVGDFTIRAAGYDIPCECSRLGRSPQVTDPKALEESLYHRIRSGTERIPLALCIKVRSTEALTGITYNRIRQLIRKGLADVRRAKLPVEHFDGPTTVAFEELSAKSEQIPFRKTDKGIAIVGDWDSAVRLSWFRASSSAEFTDRFARGEKLKGRESVRLFMKFGQPENQPDHYDRLNAKLRKKLKQTKVSANHLGKIVLIEVPFNLRTVETDKLAGAIHDAAAHSRTALGMILANREANPQNRFHYSQRAAFNQAAVGTQPELVDLLNRSWQGELVVDPILGSPYRRSWREAQAHATEAFQLKPD